MSATWNISVLTSASSDTEPTLLVNFGTAKYIFNASEAMGRSWLQSHHSFRKMKGIFLTGVGTHRCGGIAGTCVSPCSCACQCKGLFCVCMFAEPCCRTVMYSSYRANTCFGQDS